MGLSSSCSLLIVGKKKETVPNVLCCDKSTSILTASTKCASVNEKGPLPLYCLTTQQKNNYNLNEKNIILLQGQKGPYTFPDNYCIKKYVELKQHVNPVIINNSCDNNSCRQKCDDGNEKSNAADSALKIDPSVHLGCDFTDCDVVQCCSPDCNPEECEILKYEKFVSSKFGSYPRVNYRATITVAGKNLSTSTWGGQRRSAIAANRNASAINASRECASNSWNSHQHDKNELDKADGQVEIAEFSQRSPNKDLEMKRRYSMPSLKPSCGHSSDNNLSRVYIGADSDKKVVSPSESELRVFNHSQAHISPNKASCPIGSGSGSSSEGLEGLLILASGSHAMDESSELNNQLDFSAVDDKFVRKDLSSSDGDGATSSRESHTGHAIKPGDIFHVVLEKTRGSLGLNIGGGCSDPADPDGAVLVKKIVAGGAADVDGRLRVGDVILEVSGTNLVGATHHQAVDVLRSCPQLAHLTVQRGGPAAVVRVRGPAVDNHGSHLAWPPRTVTSPPLQHLSSLSEEGRSEAGEMGAVAAAMRCSEFAAKSCSSPSPRKNGSDFSHASPTRVLQNVILCSPTNEKGSSMPWTLPRSYSNGEADISRDIMALQKGSTGHALSPANENPYKTTIHVSPRKNSSPSLPVLAEQHNVVARPRRNSSDAWSTKVVVSNNAPDVIRLHVSFANKNAVNSSSQNCYPLQNGSKYSPSMQFQNTVDYQNGELLHRQISSSSDTSQRMDKAGRTVSPSISCSSKFSSSCSSLNDETPSSSRSPTPQLASVLSERRSSGSLGYITSRDTSLSSECHSDCVGNRNEIPLFTHCEANDNAAYNSRRNSCHHLLSPIAKNGGIELSNANSTKRASLNSDTYGNIVHRSLSNDTATLTATKPKAPVLRLNSMSRCGSHLQQRRRRRSSACAVSSGVDISVSDWEAEHNDRQNADGESDEESWETTLLEEFPFICEDNIFEVCLEKNSRGLGLSVCGGWDSAPADPFARLIRIKRLYPLQPAADSGLLQIGDIILTVNDIPLTGRMYVEAIEILRMAQPEVSLFVCRPEPGILPPIPQNTSLSSSGMLSSSSLDIADSITSSSRYSGPMYTEIDVTLTKIGGSLGFSLVKVDNPDGEESGGGHYIKALVKEPALSDGRLQPGDKIILVNETDISEMNHAEAIRFLRELPDEVTLCLWREVSSCPLSPLSPLSPTSPRPEEATRKKRSKPLLRKEALDMLSDKARQKANCTSPSPRSSPRIKGPSRPTAAGDDTPAPVHAATLTRGGCHNVIVPPTTALNLEESQRGTLGDDAPESVSPSLPPLTPSPPLSPTTSDDHIELRFADDTPGSNSSDLQNEDLRILRHKPKRFHSEPVTVPTNRPPLSDPTDIPSMAGSFSCSESSSCSKPTHSPARPSFLDLTPGNLSPRKQLYGRGVVVVPTHRVPPPSSSAATTSSPSAVLTDDSDSSLRYLDSGDSLLATEDDPLTTVTSSEDSPLAITLGNSALLKWRGATLASQENLTCDEPKPDNSSKLQEQSSKTCLMTVELDRGCYSRLGFSVVAIETEDSTGIYIKIVYPNSVAEGQLQAGDKLLKVNETSVSGLSAGDVILLLRKSSGRITLVIERRPDNFECSQPEVPKETADSTSGISDNSGSLTRSQSQHEELLSNEVSSLNAKNNNISRCFRWDTRPSFQDENENFAGRSHHRVNM